MNKSRVQECELCFTNQLVSGEHAECEQECEMAISAIWCQDNQSINKTKKQEHQLSVIKIGWFQGDQSVNKQGNKTVN